MRSGGRRESKERQRQACAERVRPPEQRSLENVAVERGFDWKRIAVDSGQKRLQLRPIRRELADIVVVCAGGLEMCPELEALGLVYKINTLMMHKMSVDRESWMQKYDRRY